MSRNEELDADIIHEALWGDSPGAKRAFARLYEHYEPRVRYAVARAAWRAGLVDHIDELRQEVWARFLDKDRKLLRYYKPECGPLGPFLARLAHQQAVAYAKRDQRQRSLDRRGSVPVAEVLDDDSDRFVADLVQSDVYRKLMARALDELDELDLLVLREVHLEQRRCRDVAREHGLDSNRLYKRNERLKKKLTAWSDELLAPPRSRRARPPAALLAAIVLAGLAAHLGSTGASSNLSVSPIKGA